MADFAPTGEDDIYGDLGGGGAPGGLGEMVGGADGEGPGDYAGQGKAARLFGDIHDPDSEVSKAVREQGGVELMPALAGQALNSITPRSLVGQGLLGANALTMLANPLHALALPRGDDSFRLLVDRTLSRIYRSGRIDTILAKTFGGASTDEMLKTMFVINSLPDK